MYNPQVAETILEEIKKARELGKIPAFAYDRVSDEKQTKGISLEFQEFHAQRYADQNNIHVVYFFTKVETGWDNRHRKVFRLMLEYCKMFGVKDVIFKNTDRMARNFRDLLYLQELLEEDIVILHFYLSYKVINKNSRKADKSQLELETWLNKRYSDDNSEKVTLANKYKAEKGIMPGRGPVGYIWNDKLKRHEIDSERRMMIEFMFDTFDQTQTSVRALTVLINEKGFRTGTGRKWSPSQVHYILTNPFFCGEFRYKDQTYQGAHEAYISKERYEKRMKRMHIQYHSARKRDYDFLFSGLLQCEGKALSGEIKKEKYIYYTNRFTNKSYREERIFEMLDAEIMSISFSEVFADKLKELFRESVRVKDDSNTESVAVINRRISELELKKSRLIELLIDDEIDKKALKSLTEQCNQEIDRLEEDRKRLRLNKDDFVYKMADVIDSIRKLPALYRTASASDRISLIKSISTGIDVFEDEVRVKWDLPFAFILNGEVMPFADTPEEVRKYPEMLPHSDTLRTIIFRKSFEAQLWFASKVA